VHEDPDQALSDGPNSLTFAMWDQLVGDVLKIRSALAGR
jgi:3-deoxy-D-arabino-heptulosonate 7-phosphate (DAHP) synthase